MKIAANLSLLFTELPLLQRLQAAKAAGFDAVEIQFPYEIPALVLAEELHRCDLKLALINLPAGDLMQGGLGLACRPEREADFKQALEEALDYALVVKPGKVNVLAGKLKQPAEYPKALQQLAKNLHSAAQAFELLNIELQCEAINSLDMPDYLINTPEQLLELLALVNHHNCKAQLDVYHMARQELSVEQAINLLHTNIGHVQFADYPGRGEPGSGQIDFISVINALYKVNYGGYFSAEYIPTCSTLESLQWKETFEHLLESK